MSRLRRRILLAAGILALGPATFFVLAASGAFNYEFWTRDNPLVNPIAVTAVTNGKLTLTDGRSFQPAGVTRADGIAPADYDLALSAIAAQGVAVIRDFGDGRAFLQAEPRFYNWCGTRNYKDHPFGHWAGIYIQCPLSEALVQSGYAKPNLDEPSLTSRERWRLEGAEQLRSEFYIPTKVSVHSMSLRYDSSSKSLNDFEATLELMWKPPPNP